MFPAAPLQELPLKATIVSALADRVKIPTKARDLKIALKCIANLTGELAGLLALLTCNCGEIPEVKTCVLATGSLFGCHG